MSFSFSIKDLYAALLSDIEVAKNKIKNIVRVLNDSKEMSVDEETKLHMNVEELFFSIKKMRNKLMYLRSMIRSTESESESGLSQLSQFTS